LTNSDIKNTIIQIESYAVKNGSKGRL